MIYELTSRERERRRSEVHASLPNSVDTNGEHTGLHVSDRHTTGSSVHAQGRENNNVDLKN